MSFLPPALLFSKFPATLRPEKALLLINDYGGAMLRHSILLVALLMISTVCYVPTVFSAFHSGGVGSCSGCHVGHITEGGTATSSLLLASDPSSICLTCHAGPGGNDAPSVFSFDGSAMTPGGDFYWLTKTFTWTGGSSPAARHGHNVIAADFGLSVDANKQQGPGGSYPAGNLSCISCHDPHGRSNGGTRGGSPAVSVSGSYGEIPASGSSSGNYRLLGGVGYSTNGYSFNNPAPIARQNADQPFGESDASHVDYGTGMSEWCANCHAAVLNNSHQVGSLGFEHPIGVNETLDAETVANYNSYIRTGDLSGFADTAFLQFVPFERGISVPELLDPTSTRGPDTSANISCLTCHRAHASAFRAAGRWDFNAPLLIDSHPATGDSGVSGNDVSNSYYGRDIAVEFGTGQGQFCEKCHPGGTP